MVEPPDAATARIAFSSESRVIRSLGFWPRRSTSTISSPAAYACSALVASWAGARLGPIGLMPIISKAIAIVLAVYWPPQAPAPGLAAASMSARSWSVILPAAFAPTASKTSMIVMSRPL